MDPMKAQQLAAELEVEMMADMYNRYDQATISFTIQTRSVCSTAVMVFVNLKLAFKGNRKGHLSRNKILYYKRDVRASHVAVTASCTPGSNLSACSDL